MTRQEVIGWLNNAEARFPVHQWTIGDMQVWPTVKRDLFFKWIQFDKQGKAVHVKASKPKPFLKRAANVLKLLLPALKGYKHFKDLANKDLPQTPFLFVEKNTYRTEYGGELINRHYEPIIDYIGQEYAQPVCIINVDSREAGKKYKHNDQTIFLGDIEALVQLRVSLQNNRYTIRLENFQQFLNEFDQLVSGIISPGRYQQTLYNEVELMMEYAEIYDTLLNKFNPKTVMLLGYYTIPRYAMIYAARKKGIVSIDLQHGSQGPYHVSYANFNNVPQGGYNLLPDIFWCWDQASANFIDKWVTKQSFHKVIVGGNPWVEYISGLGADKFTYPADIRIIIYTMQMDIPEDFIVETMKRVPAGYQWWLRFHPRTSDEVKRKIAEIISQNDLEDKVNTKEANEYPLPNILRNAAFHISKSSGSIIEGIQLGVSTIIIDSLGVEKFKDYVDEAQAIAFLSSNAEEFMRLLNNLSSTVAVKSDMMNIKYKNTIDDLSGKEIISLVQQP